MAIHHFSPTKYHTTIGSHEPVLRIADGHTVVTTTIDAAGYDERRQQVSAPGNPQTGPFFIDGAELGDTLAVQIERLTPNRTCGWCGRSLAANVVDPGYVRELPAVKPGELAEWHVDARAGTATLVAPATTLGKLSLPISPMLGCFGVAPAGGQAISCATSGPYGGNMDYRGFVAGVTAYFPVFAPGALFFLGDGHALQGDGEIVGSGIEISFEAQFTVRLLKKKQIFWPRGENDQFIFTVGNARPLDQALQHATTEMLRWLQSDYGLDPMGASILMGQMVEYDLGNVFDPAYTMVCKMRKSILGLLPH
jgi:acetamidase/formamidase